MATPVRLDPLRIGNDGVETPGENNELPDRWRRMAVAAMDEGFSAADVFSATHGGEFSWCSPLSGMSAANLVPFEKLLQDKDERLRKIGQIGVEHFSKLRDECLAAEK